MSDEYEYGPWIGWNGGDCPTKANAFVDVLNRYEIEEGHTTCVEWADAFKWSHDGQDDDIIAYRIATPKPKRELVVGKWYLRKGNWWSQVVAKSGNDVWLTRYEERNTALLWSEEMIALHIDWSTPPRDEAPE